MTKKIITPRLTGRKATPSERARLADYIIAKRQQGYDTNQIGAACGISASAVSNYLRQAGMPRTRIQVARSSKLMPLESFDWFDGPHQRFQPRPGSTPTGYEASSTVATLTALLRQLRGESARVRFARDVEDATIADDGEWLRHAATVVNDAMGYLAGLVKVLDEDQHRSRVIHDPSYRDEFRSQRPYLRAVDRS